MSINVTLFAQMLVFGLLVWFTMTFVWPLIREAMEEREQKITDGLAAAEKGQSDLQQAGVETEKIIGDARDQARDILSKANSRAKRHRRGGAFRGRSRETKAPRKRRVRDRGRG